MKHKSKETCIYRVHLVSSNFNHLTIFYRLRFLALAENIQQLKFSNMFVCVFYSPDMEEKWTAHMLFLSLSYPWNEVCGVHVSVSFSFRISRSLSKGLMCLTFSFKKTSREVAIVTNSSIIVGLWLPCTNYLLSVLLK